MKFNFDQLCIKQLLKAINDLGSFEKPSIVTDEVGQNSLFIKIEIK